MGLPYASATAGDKALMELQRVLANFGCSSFGTAIDVERGLTIVSFKHRNRVVQLHASWKGYAQALLRQKTPSRGAKQFKREQDAIEQAKIAVCSVLRDWVKGQITAVECGVLSFEAAFMPHMLLPSGERLVDQAAKLLPAPS